MPSVMAIVSKAVFEKAARGLDVGDVWDTDHYGSRNKGLAPVGDGGDLYLVTVRPPETLWLVAVLRSPHATGEAWKAEANTVAIRAIDELRSRIKFTSGVGITQKAGALGMSLQTPRVLTDDDVVLLGGVPAQPKPAKSVTKPGLKAAKITVGPVTPGDDLASAVEPARSGAWPQVLATSLAVWRQAPNTELADMIVKLGKLFPTAIDAKTWLPISAKHRPEALDSLLATLLDKGSIQGRERLDALSAWPTDPRIDRFVAELFATPPFTSTGARPFWTRMQPLTARIVDRTAFAKLAVARKSKTTKVYDFLGEYIDRAALVVQPDAPIDTNALSAITAALHSASATPTTHKRADAVLAEFLSNPRNDDALAPLADALIEAGDPRGELIAAQLDGSPAATKRAERIIVKHRAALLGPLAKVLLPEITFRRGFVSRGKIRRGTSAAQAQLIEKSVGHPMWATIEHLEGPDDHDITLHPVMKSLRSLVATDVTLIGLSKLNLTALDYGATEARSPGIDPLFGQAFPELEQLRIVFTYGEPIAVAKRLLESRLGKGLRTLDVGVQITSNRESPAVQRAEHTALAALFAPAGKLPDVTIRALRSADKEWGAAFHVTPEGVAISVSTHEAWEQFSVDDIFAVLPAIAKLKRPITLAKPPTAKQLAGALAKAIAAANSRRTL
jgi:hypothetical protein